MKGMNIHKNIPVSAAKLTLGLRVSFISFHLTTDKFFSVNQWAITGPPKMGLLLEAKSMPGLMIKPRLILVTHTDVLGWYITSKQAGTDVRSNPQQDCQQAKCYARADPILHQRQYSN